MNQETIQYKISMPLINDEELQRIDNYYNEIVDEFLKKYVKEKDNIIAQRIMMNLRKENQCTICFNGGMIVENKTKEMLYSKNLNAEEVEELIQLGKALRLPIMIYSRDTHYVETIPEVVQKNTKNLKGMNLKVVNFNQINFNKPENYIYKVCFIDKPEKIIEKRKQISEFRNCKKRNQKIRSH